MSGRNEDIGRWRASHSLYGSNFGGVRTAEKIRVFEHSVSIKGNVLRLPIIQLEAPRYQTTDQCDFHGWTNGSAYTSLLSWGFQGWDECTHDL